MEKICYYRIGYDRTAIERKTYNDIFRDIYFELINNVNVVTARSAGWGAIDEFKYRNYLMGTNKINILGTPPMAV